MPARTRTAAKATSAQERSADPVGATRLDLDALLHDHSTRIIVCTGAGGVGKTTVAAALGLRGVVGVPVHSGAGAHRRVSGVLEFITVDEVEPDGALAEALLEVAAHTRRRVTPKRKPAAAPARPGLAELRDDLAG